MVVVVVVVNVVVDANVFFNMFVACHLLVVAKKAKKYTGRICVRGLDLVFAFFGWDSKWVRDDL